MNKNSLNLDFHFNLLDKKEIKNIKGGIDKVIVSGHTGKIITMGSTRFILEELQGWTHGGDIFTNFPRR